MLSTCLANLREKSPLVHSITNFVTVNDCANLLLACGARPIMASDPQEAAEITAAADALNINIGTLNHLLVPAMLDAGRTANRLGIPVLLDPVGVGASSLRWQADGVHIGQDDMDAQQVRKRIGEQMILGVSAHNVEEARTAFRNGADYLGAGAVFSTSTKNNVTTLPLDILREICSSVELPVVAIGGIDCSNILKLKGTGVAGVAVVSAIFSQPDPCQAARELAALSRQIVQ